MATMGAVSATAFLDGNGNGQKDPGERDLEGVAFKVGQVAYKNRIEDPRIAFYTHLGRSQEVGVQLDGTTLEDPAMQSTVKGYRVIPRSGKVAQLDFPVAFFGEITGTTRLQGKEGLENYGGLELELLKATGERVKLFRSAYDGFFEISDLPVGSYVLRVTPREVERLKLKPVPTRTIQVDRVKTLFEGQNFVVAFAEPDASPEGERK